jgi:hypothetical protein
MHRCYACEHVFSYTAGGAVSARFSKRFEGPPGAVNGGIAVGSLACPALSSLSDDGATFPFVVRSQARLLAPMLVDRELAVVVKRQRRSHDVSIFAGREATIVGQVQSASAGRQLEADTALHELLEDQPGYERPDTGQLAHLANVAVPDARPFFEELGEHSVPGCFSCGPDAKDGMHIYPRFVGDGLVCAPWTPPLEFEDGNGAVSPMIIAAALDCSSGICIPRETQRELIEQDRFFLLGSLSVSFLRLPPVGRDYRVVGKLLRRDGRKFFGLSALFDEGGTPYACAEATWIVAGITRSEAFGARLIG